MIHFEPDEEIIRAGFDEARVTSTTRQGLQFTYVEGPMRGTGNIEIDIGDYLGVEQVTVHISPALSVTMTGEKFAQLLIEHLGDDAEADAP